MWEWFQTLPYTPNLLGCHSPSVCVDRGGRGEVNDSQDLLPPVPTFLFPPSPSCAYLQHSNTSRMAATTNLPSQLCITSYCHSPHFLVDRAPGWKEPGWDPRVQKEGGHHSLTSTSSSHYVSYTWQSKNEEAIGRANRAKRTKDNWHWLPLWYLGKIKFLITIPSPTFLLWSDQRTTADNQHASTDPGELTWEFKAGWGKQVGWWVRSRVRAV